LIKGNFYGDSFVRLKPAGGSLIPKAFAPDNADTLEDKDADLGSGGAMIIPDSNVVIGGGKTGFMYLLDRNSMQLKQQFAASTNQYNPSDRDTSWEAGPHLHGSPTYWRGPDPKYGYLYVWGEKDFLKQYRFDVAKERIEQVEGLFATVNGVPYHQGTVKALRHPMPGGMLSVSADKNKSGTGIVWATLPVSEWPKAHFDGRLYAFDAKTLEPLWDSAIGTIAHWVPPTIADGKVFVANGDKQLIAFELFYPKGTEVGMVRNGSCADIDQSCEGRTPYQPQPTPWCTSCHYQELRLREMLNNPKPLHALYPNEASVRAWPALAFGQLAPPAGSKRTLVLEGSGLQMYQASSTADRKLIWSLKETTADLLQAGSPASAKENPPPIHVRISQGTVWSASDGSTAIGELQKTALAPELTDTPWALFKVIKSSDRGILSQQRYIQCVYTHAGRAPATSPKRRGEITRVPYHAQYWLYQ
jgi:hypothetical protein